MKGKDSLVFWGAIGAWALLLVVFYALAIAPADGEIAAKSEELGGDVNHYRVKLPRKTDRVGRREVERLNRALEAFRGEQQKALAHLDELWSGFNAPIDGWFRPPSHMVPIRYADEFEALRRNLRRRGVLLQSETHSLDMVRFPENLDIDLIVNLREEELFEKRFYIQADIVQLLQDAGAWQLDRIFFTRAGAADQEDRRALIQRDLPEAQNLPPLWAFEVTIAARLPFDRVNVFLKQLLDIERYTPPRGNDPNAIAVFTRRSPVFILRQLWLDKLEGQPLAELRAARRRLLQAQGLAANDRELDEMLAFPPVKLQLEALVLDYGERQ